MCDRTRNEAKTCSAPIFGSIRADYVCESALSRTCGIGHFRRHRFEAKARGKERMIEDIHERTVPLPALKAAAKENPQQAMVQAGFASGGVSSCAAGGVCGAGALA
jgi:hypothetical protein